MTYPIVSLPEPARDADRHRVARLGEEFVWSRSGAPDSRHVVSSSRVCVADMTLSADIGVYAEEAATRQELVVTVTLEVLPPASDALAYAFDYTGIERMAHALASERVGLIETFALRLAEQCLQHPLVREADVHVKKPGALANGLASARMVVRESGAGGDRGSLES